MFLKIKKEIEKATGQIIEQAEKDFEILELPRLVNEIVDSISKITYIQTLPNDKDIDGYNEMGDKLFDAIYKIIKNHLL